jgi:hypothetical protein
MKLGGVGLTTVSISQPCAWTSIRNMSLPKAFDASTIPLDSQFPSRWPVGSELWSTRRTTSRVPVFRLYRQARAAVFPGPAGRAYWLCEPGSSAMSSAFFVVSTLSGWWVTFGLL